MKIIIAVDSFKGSLSSIEAGQAIKRGLLEAMKGVDAEVCPMADGGEGTVEAIIQAKNGEKKAAIVNGPLMEPVTAQFVVFPYNGEDHVFIESAASSGLTLITTEKRTPMQTNTYGLGEQIAFAVKAGYRKFFLSLGGSATNDAGIGMLQALGWKFFDENDEQLGINGNPLLKVASMSAEHVIAELKDCEFTIASDVLNPFYGPDGAAHVFARQKGANDDEITELDQALERFSGILFKETGLNVQEIRGAGAAGGLGGAMAACLNADMRSGAELLIEITGLNEKIQSADLVITGEGSLDWQSLFGKVPVAIAHAAKRHRVPVIGIAGRIDTELKEINQHLDAVFSIQTECRSLEEAMTADVSKKQLEVTAGQVIRAVKMGV